MNNNGFSKVKTVLILLFTMLLLTGGWFVYRFIFQPVSPVSIPIATPPTTKPPQPSTYTDPLKIYSVMYPAQWSAHTQDATDITVPITPIDNDVVNFIPVAPSDSGFGIDGLIDLMAFKSDPQTIMADSSVEDANITTKSLTLNGYEAYFVQKVDTNVPTYTDDEYVIYHNGVTLMITFRKEQGSSQFVQGYDASDQLPNFNYIANSVKFMN